jgi:hypothetical protein
MGWCLKCGKTADKQCHGMAVQEGRFRCPACLERTLTERDAYEICACCRWEDDPHQRMNPVHGDRARGELSPNNRSLISGIAHAIGKFQKLGDAQKVAILLRYREHVCNSTDRR